MCSVVEGLTEGSTAREPELPEYLGNSLGTPRNTWGKEGGRLVDGGGDY